MRREESKTKVLRLSGLDSGEPEREQNQLNMGVCERCVCPCLAELFGTMLFVFVACSCVVVNTDAVTPAAVVQGLGLTALILLLGNISGGHFNPAVSLSLYLCGRVELLLLLLYIPAQVAGAVVGAALAKAAFPSVAYAASCGGAFSVVETSTGVCEAVLAETVMTLFLCTVVCLLAMDNQSGSHMAPFCVGLTVTGCMLAGASVSGACMNPARAFGPAVAADHWKHHWIYWVGPCCGALLTPGFVGLWIGDQQALDRRPADSTGVENKPEMVEHRGTEKRPTC